MDKYQLRAARAMLGLTLHQLSKEVDVSHEAINKIETGAVKRPRAKTLEALVDFFEAKGLQFGKQSSVGFRSKLIQEIESEDYFLKLLQDIHNTLEPGDELLVACTDDSTLTPATSNAYRKILDKGIKMRRIIEEGNSYILGQITNYKYLQKENFHDCPILIYKNKFAYGMSDAGKALIIEDDALSRTLRNLFNLLWINSNQPDESTANESF